MKPWPKLRGAHIQKQAQLRTNYPQDRPLIQAQVRTKTPPEKSSHSTPRADQGSVWRFLHMLSYYMLVPVRTCTTSASDKHTFAWASAWHARLTSSAPALCCLPPYTSMYVLVYAHGALLEAIVKLCANTGVLQCMFLPESPKYEQHELLEASDVASSNLHMLPRARSKAVYPPHFRDKRGAHVPCSERRNWRNIHTPSRGFFGPGRGLLPLQSSADKSEPISLHNAAMGQWQR